MLRKSILTLLIAISLVAVPVPSFAAMSMAPGGEHCMMQAEDGSGMYMMSEQAGDDCPHCRQDARHQCDESGCSTGNCVSAHAQTVAFPVMALVPVSPARVLQPAMTGIVDSRVDPPLLRPPV